MVQGEENLLESQTVPNTFTVHLRSAPRSVSLSYTCLYGKDPWCLYCTLQQPLHHSGVLEHEK